MLFFHLYFLELEDARENNGKVKKIEKEG